MAQIIKYITSVITILVLFKGAITSNKALKNQALELKRMMGKIASTANKTYTENNIQQPETDARRLANRP